jgi:hypothetical protein
MEQFGFLCNERGNCETFENGDLLELDSLGVLKVTRTHNVSTKLQEQRKAIDRQNQLQCEIMNELTSGREGNFVDVRARLRELSNNAISYQFKNMTTTITTYFPPHFFVQSKLFPHPVMFVPHGTPVEAVYNVRIQETEELSAVVRKPRLLCVRKRADCMKIAPGFQDVADALDKMLPKRVVTLVYCRNETILAACDREVFQWIAKDNKWMRLGYLEGTVCELACNDKLEIYAATQDKLWFLAKDEDVWCSVLNWTKNAQLAGRKDELFVVAESKLGQMNLLIIRRVLIWMKRTIDESPGGCLVETSESVFRVQQEPEHFMTTIHAYAGGNPKGERCPLPAFMSSSCNFMVIDDKPVFFGNDFPDVTRTVEDPLKEPFAALLDPVSGSWTAVGLISPVA